MDSDEHGEVDYADGEDCPGDPGIDVDEEGYNSDDHHHFEYYADYEDWYGPFEDLAGSSSDDDYDWKALVDRAAREEETVWNDSECLCGETSLLHRQECHCSACGDARHEIVTRAGGWTTLTRCQEVWVWVRASTIVEWIAMWPGRWDKAPSELISWCVRVANANKNQAVAVLVASNREALVRHVADAMRVEALAYGPWVLTAERPSWWRSDPYSVAKMTSVAEAAFLAAMAKGNEATLAILAAAAPQFFADCGRGHHDRYFEAAVKGDNADAVEFMLRHGYDPITIYSYTLGRMIEKWGSRRVLQRLLDLKRRSLAACWPDDHTVTALSRWDDPQRAIVSAPLLELLFSAGEHVDLDRLLDRACAESNVESIAWALATYPERLSHNRADEMLRLAKRAVTAWHRASGASSALEGGTGTTTADPEAVVRWLFDPERDGAYVPSREALAELLRHIVAPKEMGDARCALYLLERWPREVAALDPYLVASVVRHVFIVGDARFVCTSCVRIRSRCRCSRYAPTEALMERVVRALDACSVQPGGQRLTARIDLWRLLIEAARLQWEAGRRADHHGTCAMLRYAHGRANEAREWARWCQVRPIAIGSLRPTEATRTITPSDLLLLFFNHGLL